MLIQCKIQMCNYNDPQEEVLLDQKMRVLGDVPGPRAATEETGLIFVSFLGAWAIPWKEEGLTHSPLWSPCRCDPQGTSHGSAPP